MPSFFRLFSSAVQTIMQPYNKLSPELRTQFQGFLHRTFGENQLRLTDLSTKLIVQVNAPSSLHKKDTQLTDFIEDLKSKGMVDYNIEQKIDTVKYGEEYGKLIYFSAVNITAFNPTLLEKEVLKISAAETPKSSEATSPAPRK